MLSDSYPMNYLGAVAVIVVSMGVLAGFVVLWVDTARNIARSGLSPVTKLAWVTVALLLPLLGPLLWRLTSRDTDRLA